MIYLVRHGETDANATRVLQRPDVPLSRRGRAQAERLARRLAGRGVTRILTSDLARARQTAEALSAATGAPLVLDPLLQERNFGDLRGTPYAELAENPFGPDYVPPGGESWQDFDARVDRAWHLVRESFASAGGALVVVTHGLVCRSLLGRHADLAPRTAPDRFDNTALSEIDPRPPYRVGALNCTGHLDDDTRAPDAQRAGRA